MTLPKKAVRGLKYTDTHTTVSIPVNTPSQPQAPLEAAIRRARGNGADIPIPRCSSPTYVP